MSWQNAQGEPGPRIEPKKRKYDEDPRESEICRQAGSARPDAHGVGGRTRCKQRECGVPRTRVAAGSAPIQAIGALGVDLPIRPGKRERQRESVVIPAGSGRQRPVVKFNSGTTTGGVGGTNYAGTDFASVDRVIDAYYGSNDWRRDLLVANRRKRRVAERRLQLRWEPILERLLGFLGRSFGYL
jgi:hypothetical protein